MSAFLFNGSIPTSKSLLNRALIVKSHFSEFNIYGDSFCNDVIVMKQAVEDFENGKTTINCGEAGTVLRFMALRVAREQGEFLLTGSGKLLSRLPDDLIQLLSQLGSQVELIKEGFKVKSVGWKIMGDALHLQAKLSSQFATAVFLNAWNYPLDLFITVPKSMFSMSYFKMTLNFLSSLGMSIYSNKTEYHIPKNQALVNSSYVGEADMSSTFAIAAAAIINGEAKLNSFSENSIQPDTAFINILNQMNIDYEIENSSVHFFKQDEYKNIDISLKDSPDLFPVLSVLSSFASGTSRLYGAEHLIHKESNRIEATFDLLSKAGVEVTKTDDGLVIEGNPNIQPNSFSFDARKDHRIAMAAALLMLKGYNIELTGRDTVNKSFPEFWDIIGL